MACHTLSRDGTRLAVGYNGELLREVSVPERELIVSSPATAAPAPMPPGTPGMPPAMTGIAAAWSTFSPDGTLLLIAANGVLTLIDADSGAPLGANSGLVPLPAASVATHPDWNATGDYVALTLGKKGGNKEVEGGAIARLPYNGGDWGEPEILVPNAGGEDNNFFPVWSPDSRFIAFVNAAGKSKDATSARLRLLRVEDAALIDVTRVNQRVGPQDNIVDLGNSMPTWAPSTNPGIFWLAFSSLRAYATLRPKDDKEDQIWIAAIDPTQQDPSYAAFWAPFQAIEEGNHRAFWTHASDDTQCKCLELCGDALDNDCDGTADEDDCAQCQAQEICDDGIDNDCDCVIDDCNLEICGDGSDNDGDGLTDSEDPSCAVK